MTIEKIELVRSDEGALHAVVEVGDFQLQVRTEQIDPAEGTNFQNYKWVLVAFDLSPGNAINDGEAVEVECRGEADALMLLFVLCNSEEIGDAITDDETIADFYERLQNSPLKAFMP